MTRQRNACNLIYPLIGTPGGQASASAEPVTLEGEAKADTEDRPADVDTESEGKDCPESDGGGDLFGAHEGSLPESFSALSPPLNLTRWNSIRVHSLFLLSTFREFVASMLTRNDFIAAVETVSDGGEVVGSDVKIANESS
jgi:hypothetical protein